MYVSSPLDKVLRLYGESSGRAYNIKGRPRAKIRMQDCAYVVPRRASGRDDYEAEGEVGLRWWWRGPVGAVSTYLGRPSQSSETRVRGAHTGKARHSQNPACFR